MELGSPSVRKLQNELYVYETSVRILYEYLQNIPCTLQAITILTKEDTEIFNSLQSWGTDHLEKARRYVRRISGQGRIHNHCI